MNKLKVSKSIFGSSQVPVFFYLFVVLIAVFFAFSPVLNAEFLNWDDREHILENPAVKSLDSDRLTQTFTQRVNKIYIPLTTLSFALEHHFFGFNPTVFHLNNVLLHLLVVALVFCIGVRLGMFPAASALAAFLFGIHPMHVESVAWITERKDVLYAAFYLAAVHQFLIYLDRKRIFHYVLSLGLGALSLLAKPMAISLPLILLLVEWFKGEKKGVGVANKIPFFILAMGIGWITYSAEARTPHTEFFPGLLTWIWTFAFYLKKFFFPLDLTPIYNLPQPVSLAHPEFMGAIAIFIAVLLLAWLGRAHRWPQFALGFYFLSIFFLLRFDAVRDVNIVADRFMYLPSLGLCWWLGKSAFQMLRAQQNPVRLTVLGALMTCLLVSYSIKTMGQVGIWTNSYSLWTHQMKLDPSEPVAYQNLAVYLAGVDTFEQDTAMYRSYIKLSRAGYSEDQISSEHRKSIARVERVMQLYKKAIVLDTQRVETFYNLGNLYRDLDLKSEALKLYAHAITLDPKFKNARFEYALLSYQEGLVNESLAAFEQVIATDPLDDDAYYMVVRTLNQLSAQASHREQIVPLRDRLLAAFTQRAFLPDAKLLSLFNVGVLYAETGDYEQSLRAFRLATQRDPRYLKAIYGMGKIYEQMRDYTLAREAYEKVLAIDPRNTEAYISLGQLNASLQNFSAGIDLLKKALAINPRHAIARYNLGFLYETTGQLDLAQKEYLLSVEIDPRQAEAYYNLGNVQAGLGEFGKAMDSYQQALGVNPDHLNACVNLSLLAFKVGDYKKASLYNELAQMLGYRTPTAIQHVLDANKIK